MFVTYLMQGAKAAFGVVVSTFTNSAPEYEKGAEAQPQQINSSGLFDPSISERISGIYKNVEPSLVNAAHRRFGEQALVDLHQIVKAFYANAKATPLTTLEGIYTSLHTIALRILTWVGDSVKKKLPTSVEKNLLADKIALDLSQTINEILAAAEKVRAKGLDWQNPEFITKFNRELDARFNKKLGLSAHALSTKQLFYDRIASCLLSCYEQHQSQILPQWLQHLAQAINVVQPNLKHNYIRDMLILAHETFTDPIRLKSLLIENVFNTSSQAMEEKYSVFLEHLESPQSKTTTKRYNNAYGQFTTGIIRTLQPKVGWLNLISLYEWLMGDSIDKGEDKLSVILRDIVGDLVEEGLKPDTDEWVKSVLNLVKQKNVSPDGILLECPVYIPESVWKEVQSIGYNINSEPKTPKERELSKKIIALQSSYEQRVDKEFLESSERLAKSVLKAGLVFEQFLETARQAAINPERSLLCRILFGFVALILGFPFVCILFELIHRSLIWAREKIVDLLYQSTGSNLASSVDVLLKSKAVDFVFMSLLWKSLEHLDLLQSHESKVLSGLVEGAESVQV